MGQPYGEIEMELSLSLLLKSGNEVLNQFPLFCIQIFDPDK
jgi:hypothetical protein